MRPPIWVAALRAILILAAITLFASGVAQTPDILNTFGGGALLGAALWGLYYVLIHEPRRIDHDLRRAREARISLPRGYYTLSGANPHTGQPRTALYRASRDGKWLTFTPIAVINADHITPTQAEDLTRLAWKDAKQ